MESYNNIIEKLKALDDGEISNAAATVGEILGIKGAQRIASNPKALRRRLNGITDSDIEKIVSSLGEEQTAELIRAIGLDTKGE